MLDLSLSVIQYIFSSVWDLASRIFAPAALGFVFLAFIPFAVLIGCISATARRVRSLAPQSAP